MKHSDPKATYRISETSAPLDQRFIASALYKTSQGAYNYLDRNHGFADVPTQRFWVAGVVETTDTERDYATQDDERWFVVLTEYVESDPQVLVYANGHEVVRDSFSLADDPSVVGYHDPRNRWNGFANPRLPLASVLTIAEQISHWEDPATAECALRVHLDSDGVTVIVTDTEPTLELAALDTIFVDRISPDEHGLYPLLNYGHCWSADSEWA